MLLNFLPHALGLQMPPPTLPSLGLELQMLLNYLQPEASSKKKKVLLCTIWKMGPLKSTKMGKDSWEGQSMAELHLCLK